MSLVNIPTHPISLHYKRTRQVFINSIAILLLFQVTVAQNSKGKIIDFATKESIPYASIMVNNTDHLVSNAEGHFTLSEGNSKDDTVLSISYLGYLSQVLTVGQLKKLDFTIALAPSVFELDDVTINTKKPNPYEIMASVKANLNRNYKDDGLPSKDLLFYRKSNNFKPKEIEVEINKSTGFSKQALIKVNTDIQTFSKQLITNPPVEFSDLLGNLYTCSTKKDGKYFSLNKLDVLKATKLDRDGSSFSTEELKKVALNKILQHLDSTKYYRVKSGLFGSRDTISLRKEFNQRKRKNKIKEANPLLTSTKFSLNRFLVDNHLLFSSQFYFIKKTELYDYTYEGTTYTEDNESAYILTFKPRSSKAKYVGKIYISETDFAVLRVEYTLDSGEKLNSFNLKLLLGVKAAENISKGTIIYKKKANGNGYYLQYATIERGQYFYVNRPLKFIELSSGEKDVLSLDIKIEGSSSEKTEFLNMSHSMTTESTIEKLTESEFKFINIKSYDPKIWKGYNTIEPLEELKRLQSIN